MFPEIDRFLDDIMNEKSSKEKKALKKRFDNARLKTLSTYIEGITETYMLIPLEEAYTMITRDYGENITEEDLFDICRVFSTEESYCRFVIFGSDHAVSGDPESSERPLIIHESLLVVDVEFYDEMKRLQADKPYKVLPKEYILWKADNANSDNGAIPDEVSSLYEYLKEHGVTDENAKRACGDFVIEASQEKFDPYSAMRDVFRFSEVTDPSSEMICRVYDLCLKVRNFCPLSINRGYSPAETEELKKQLGKDWETGYVLPNTPENVVRCYRETRSKREEIIQLRDELFGGPGKFPFLMNDDGSIFVHDKSQNLKKAKKTGRNDPCPCGSGKKYKKCCGR